MHRERTSLLKGEKAEKLPAGSHRAQSRACVADAGDDGGKGLGKGKIVQGDHQGGTQGDHGITGDKKEHGGERGLVHRLAVQLHDLHRAGVDDAVDLPADGPASQQDAEHLMPPPVEPAQAPHSISRIKII